MSAIVIPSADVESKRADIKRNIDQAYIDWEGQERNHAQQRTKRNVLLIGPSKSGKTTLVYTLRDPTYVPEDMSLRPSLQIKPIPYPAIYPDLNPIELNIFELPATMMSETRDLFEINQECDHLKLHEVHLICLCASFDAGIDGYTVQSFERLINHLGREQLKHNLCLIITRCESKGDRQRQLLRDELKEDTEYKRLIEYCERGIHFSGALNYDDWNDASEALYNQFQTVYNYRKNLMDLIEKSIEPFKIQVRQQRTPSQTTSASKAISVPMPTSK